jgi:hypothetical protein
MSISCRSAGYDWPLAWLQRAHRRSNPTGKHDAIDCIPQVSAIKQQGATRDHRELSRFILEAALLKYVIHRARFNEETGSAVSGTGAKTARYDNHPSLSLIGFRVLFPTLQSCCAHRLVPGVIAHGVHQ